MPSPKEALEIAGLTSAEAAVYIALLKTGSATAGEIAKASDLHRRTVYDVVKSLSKKGIVGSITKNNRSFYEAVRPERLRDLIREKEAAIESVLPQLAVSSVSKKREDVRFFSGRYGLKAIFEDQIAERKPILIFGASALAWDLFKFYFKWFDARRKQYRIPVKAIFSSAIKSTVKKIPLAEIRFLPEKYVGITAINIYGDKISLILWSRENPFGILIENKEIADSYRRFFELMWKQVKA